MHASHLISISRVEKLQEVDVFLSNARALMFGVRFAGQEAPADIQNFERVYGGAEGKMWSAVHRQQGVVGSIAYRKYDGRFAQLDFGEQSVVEIVRLFVAPAWRRHGLAMELFSTLRAQVKAEGVQVLYLHTHPFLSGAQEFWLRNGFQVLEREVEPVWQTIHMQSVLSREP
ncbi:GNAT family N-acetyltransferase [Comamonas kerstersii]|uniref:GNAT family N-acetyltransferase n=1 Tax=Comamonas kerstersii TaxID=225992 RepID=UPI001B3401C9|nr:GNAT family N-acetyltransferase [Comamonas kerstersii]QTW19975.1 GNAT family N-acetyltransferase [Comamonas kerstersii]